MTATELEAEIVDALRFGASPLDGIAECVRCDAEEVLEVLLDLEQRDLVRRHPVRGQPVPAGRRWWELTVDGDKADGAG